MYNYWQQLKKETSAALLWTLEHEGYYAFLKKLDLLYDRLSPDALDEDLEFIYGEIPYTPKELIDMYAQELKGHFN